MAKHAQHGRMKHFNRYFTMIARQPQLNVHHDCHQMDPHATVSSAGAVKDQIKGYVCTAMVGLSAPVCATQTVDQRSYVRTTNTDGVHRLVCMVCGTLSCQLQCLVRVIGRSHCGVSETGLEL